MSEANRNKAFLEVSAGVGGTESRLFASEIFDMYKCASERRNWKFETVAKTLDEGGGMKAGLALMQGEGVLSQMKFESGCHRVQRVPVTEKRGRIHTSIVKVSVLPEAESEVARRDLKIDTYRSKGPGGQHVNKTESAVRITHLPTGTVVSCESSRSQHRNKELAFEALASKLRAMQEKELERSRENDFQSVRVEGIRSEKIRSYNWPSDRVTDHRVKMSVSGVERMLKSSSLERFWSALHEKDCEELVIGLSVDAILEKKINFAFR